MSTTFDKLSRLNSSATSEDSAPDASFLTVPQLAELLHVNEKKIYQLAGVGEIPGTKVTGKWIFPRKLIEDWLLENSHGGVMHDRLLIAGSGDSLIQALCAEAAVQWQQQALVSYSPCGTRHGLRMLDTGRVDACFMHWGASEDSARRHMGLLRRYRNHHSWVIVRCLQRNQGLLLAPGLSRDLEADPQQTSAIRSDAKLLDMLVKDEQLRWAVRCEDSGSMRLLEDWCSIHGRSVSDLRVGARCASETATVAALYREEADLCCGGPGTARDFSLGYLPVSDISLDLVMTRKTYFRTLVQDFIARLQDATAHNLADRLGGYTILASARLMTIE